MKKRKKLRLNNNPNLVCFIEQTDDRIVSGNEYDRCFALLIPEAYARNKGMNGMFNKIKETAKSKSRFVSDSLNSSHFQEGMGVIAKKMLIAAESPFDVIAMIKNCNIVVDEIRM